MAKQFKMNAEGGVIGKVPERKPVSIKNISIIARMTDHHMYEIQLPEMLQYIVLETIQKHSTDGKIPVVEKQLKKIPDNLTDIPKWIKKQIEIAKKKQSQPEISTDSSQK